MFLVILRPQFCSMSSEKNNIADREILARTEFWLIFRNSLPHKFKLLANIETTYFKIAVLVTRILAWEFKNSQMIEK